MQRYTTILAVLIGLLLTLVAQPALANDGDRIWDAKSSVNGTDLKAKYKESPENGLLDQTLEVQIEDAPANVTLFIAINGHVVGEMTTNAFGRGEFRKDILGVQPAPDGRPRGPRINTGDVIRVYRGGQGISATFVERQ